MDFILSCNLKIPWIQATALSAVFSCFLWRLIKAILHWTIFWKSQHSTFTLPWRSPSSQNPKSTPQQHAVCRPHLFAQSFLRLLASHHSGKQLHSCWCGARLTLLSMNINESLDGLAPHHSARGGEIWGTSHGWSNAVVNGKSKGKYGGTENERSQANGFNRF